eukprot:jgi/Tetstr1/444390/TSEL_032280.t1
MSKSPTRHSAASKLLLVAPLPRLPLRHEVNRVTGSVVSDTGTPTEIQSILANSSLASIPATEPLPAGKLDISAESHGSQPRLEGDLAPSRLADHRLAIAPKRCLDTNCQHALGNHGRYANGRSKQSRCCRCYRDDGEEHSSSYYCVQCGITLCMPSSVHSWDCWEHHLHCDETAIRRLKPARAG